MSDTRLGPQWLLGVAYRDQTTGVWFCTLFQLRSNRYTEVGRVEKEAAEELVKVLRG